MIVLSILTILLIALKFANKQTLAFFRYLGRLGIALSVLFNVILGGPNNQSFSARNWARKRNNKWNLVWFIDFCCVIIAYVINKINATIKTETTVDFSDHCMTSWVYWRSRKDVIHDINNSHIKD